MFKPLKGSNDIMHISLKIVTTLYSQLEQSLSMELEEVLEIEYSEKDRLQSIAI